MVKPVREAKTDLILSVKELEENGPTALGPAIACAVALAQTRGCLSQVIICTDGMANIGVGSFSNLEHQAGLGLQPDFYDQIGEYSNKHGVTINVVSIIGDECNLDHLSVLSSQTGGQVHRVDPPSLAHNFSEILQEDVLASNVNIKVFLPDMF